MTNTVISLKQVLVGDNETQQFNVMADFEVKAALGKKGTRNLDRLTALSIYGIGTHMDDLREQQQADPTCIGTVVGSAQGSMDSIVRFTYESLAYDKPDYVNPALFPNTVMNCAAGQSAIWHGLKGPNTTISAGELSGLAAIQYGLSLIENRYAKTLLVGGCEELSQTNKKAFSALAQQYNETEKFTEASVFFVMESAETAEQYGRTPIATVLSCLGGFNPEPSNAAALKSLIADGLQQADVTSDKVRAVSLGGLWPNAKEIERMCLAEVFDEHVLMIDAYEQYGNANSAHFTLQISALLDELQPGEIGVAYAQCIKGNTGMVVIRKEAV
ncbi:beta-ketoacyl synthase N-terminal-like domain-containing protein [Pseudoalteromonas sp. OOF1S-7]|uniref:beta-ketoacyl synthase N-terminal-like domain-containing protein n=1 Tax=Pseudoalteromonas sp. OOF1S-7 TaxID=2917757 RepID=UPI001EF6E090|nr:beta-ketoacyl synthase N-terminal-like domain-containing protein [Pseudoalteromonas sp. OOF1S-7]MCG7536693.1 hypothetical protein [Pseudoalteromonas sp. OOF1S-7]